ncbi:MAG: C40 family peptidase [Eubacteriales bacterium]
MKKRIAASVAAVFLLLSGPGQAVLARPASNIYPAPVINSLAASVRQAAAKLKVLPEPGQRVPSRKRSPSRDNSRSTAQITRIAISLRGTPYKRNGQSPEGFDCSGFTRYVFKAGGGIDLPRTSAEQARVGTAVSRNNLEPGDIVYFNTSGEGVSHVGIFIGGDAFISSTTSVGVKVDSLADEYWNKRYLGARRVV